jgi:hypothetical protein
MRTIITTKWLRVTFGYIVTVNKTTLAANSVSQLP